MKSDVLVIGGGAAGMVAAGMAAERGLRVVVLERNPRMARKILLTGKGRCNITNNCTPSEFITSIPGNGKFLYSAITAFTPQDMMELLQRNGLKVKTERGNRVFPESDRAMDVVDTLVSYAKRGGCRFETGRAVKLIIRDDICVGAEDERGRVFSAPSVIVSTGGLSYSNTGCTGDGYVLAGQAGHTVIPTRPSLVPLVSSDAWCAELQGLSLRNCGLKVMDTKTGKTLYTDFGEMLFTHFGVSGPLILSAGAHMCDMSQGRYRLIIDLKPALTPEQLDARLLRDIGEIPNRELSALLAGLLPRSMCPVMAELAELSVDMRCRDITREHRRKLGELLKSMPVTIEDFRPIEEAVITAGGVSVKEINAKTMESKLLPGLYFAGEVIDVDGYTGGFNLQIAFSTGAAAGRYC